MTKFSSKGFALLLKTLNNETPEIAIIDFCLLIIAAAFFYTRTCKPNRFIHNILWREICMV